MPVKIRLQRHGRKGYAYYHIVAADSRAPRDGKFIERVGSYNPNTNPATIDLNFDRALYWVQTGAQPTDTVRTILSDEGVYMKKHLLGGVKKNAFDEAEAEKRFEKWLNDKQSKLTSQKSKLAEEDRSTAKARIAAEKEANKAKEAAIAKKKAEALEALVAESKAELEAAQEAAGETPAAE
ncbi:MAG: 30S ribosomal protein S16 [Prevotellaceae bacterium]|jgi:small subunit ribosomal protein S16|nr:30S ribosomal protein S16 [Prevotellaceae bacterium]